MFIYRVKVEELDRSCLLSLKHDLARSEPVLRAKCPIREMSVISHESDRKLDIYLALDDFIDAAQLRSLAGDLNSLLDAPPRAPRVSSELIHI
ncbi:MAG: hypothetical protein ACREPT_02045 [Rudaea sp.]